MSRERVHRMPLSKFKQRLRGLPDEAEVWLQTPEGLLWPVGGVDVSRFRRPSDARYPPAAEVDPKGTGPHVVVVFPE